MSVNWSKRDLVSKLKIQTVRAEDVLLGDILVEDYGPWQVAEIQYGKDTVKFWDEDKNGFECPNDAVRCIVWRDALKQRPR